MAFELGVREANADVFREAMQAAAGVPVKYERIYVQGQNWPWADVIAADAAGFYVCVSQKSPDWAADAAGTRDAHWRAIATGLSQLKPGTFTYHHEPENDGLPAANWKAGYRHVIEPHEPLMPGWRFGPVYIDWSFSQAGMYDGAVTTWYPGDDVVDVLLTDPYNWQGAKTIADGGNGYAVPGVNPRAPASIFNGVCRLGAEKHKPVIFGEFGSARLELDVTGAG